MIMDTSVNMFKAKVKEITRLEKIRRRQAKRIAELEEDIENRKDYESYLQGTDLPMRCYNYWLKNLKRLNPVPKQ
jgi:hypothetical protein